MLTTKQIASKVLALQNQYTNRDDRMNDVLDVRRGNLQNVAPDLFPEGMPKALVANFIDVAARDISEVLAPLPSFNCSASNMNNDRARKRADRRTVLANHYVQVSKLQTQMYYGADWYLSYGFLPIVVEADWVDAMPRIRVENPLGAYPEYDRHGRIISFTKRYQKTIRQLINEFPEYESQILGRQGRDNTDLESPLELIRYEDKDQIVLYLPDRSDFVLAETPNPMGRVMVVVARRPSIDPDDPRGQFDDVIYPQLARARFAWLAMDAAEKSVNAPLAVPQDVQEFAFGPDAILRSSQPQGIRRVGLELPPSAFQEQQVLEAELRMGARYPEGRSGQIDASIITGSGVQALLGGFDTQVKSAQQVFQEMFEDVIGLCFQMDEMLFPGQKIAAGIHSGAQYELEYDPAKDIAGDYTVQARYGLMAGLDPNRALIFALQALQANLTSRDFIMRELPWAMNVTQEQERIDVERMRDNLAGSFASLAQAIPSMATQGQDPSDMVRKMAEVIDMRRNGKLIEDAVMQAFAPVEQPQAAPQMTPQDMLSAMGGNQPVEQAPAATPAPPEAAAAAPSELGAPPQQPQDIGSMLAAMGGGG